MKNEVINLFRNMAMMVVLCVLGVCSSWASSSDYARGFAKVSSSSPSGAGKVYVAYTSSGGSRPATPAASSSSWKTSEASAQAEGSKTTFDFYYYSLPTSGYALEGWSETDGASDYSNESVAKYSIKTSSCTLNDAYTDVRLYAHFVPNPTVTVTFLTPDPKCTYTVKCDGANVAVGSSKTTNKSFDLAVTVNDANYKLLGWYMTTDGGVTKSYFSPNYTYTNKYFPQTCSVGVELVEVGKPVFMVGDKLFTDLNAANTAAGGSGTIVLVSDGLLDVGNYTISSGNTLLIPHTIGSTFVNSKSVINEPYIVKTASALSAFRKLTLQEGVNITVNGKICVAGKMMSSGGGKASAYPTGEIGMIDMSRGGHIELNSGAVLYAWGFIKGQDMDQGNNTTGIGAITAKGGSVVWEGFATGDWRGGSASSTLYDNASSWRFFPFQSYTVQNIEVPVTYNYNSKLSNYMSIFGDGQVYNGTFDLIGSSNTLFLLKNSSSKLKKWYDPTTDLVCYEMSGSTQLDALNVDAAGETVSSKDYNLPISTSMHIIMASSTTISKPVEIQAGAVIEIKSGATVTCSSNVYLFDKDQWGEYCNSKYYYTMTNLSIHKDRGDGKSNAMIDDAKLIIDGTLNVTGKLYTTSGGADIMGNGGGKISFGTLASNTNIVMCTGVSTNENVSINQACLHNEDDTYTQAIASTTFHNVNGRWFTAAAKDGKADHSYDFTYISSGAVSGTGGTNTTTDAVYSWDKTGLELRQKWFNVTADGCANWWHGQGEQTTWFYNWTLNDTWHQFIPTATPDLYSGSNNTLYTKTSCTWEELGSTDVNCLYEIGGVKKALVDGQFVALEANNNDPAYHEAEDPTKYYICFEGCNWHAADKYTEAEKAYTVESETFIWYNNAWMSVNFQEQFAYTIDETSVPVYYEYIDGEWVLAEPYVRVVDGLDDRNFWFLADAFKFANSALRISPTITILRDISGITTAVSYTGANKTCTLNLNGHTITGSVSGMITVNAAGCTFNIEDNTTEKLGKINLVFSANNSRRYALNVKNGHVKLKSGTVSGTCTLAYDKTSAPKPLTGCVVVAAGKQFTMDGGKVEAISAYNPIAIFGSEGAPTITINDGIINSTAQTIDSPYGIQSYGTINFNKGTINATAEKSSTAVGIYVHASAKAQGTLNMIDGTINATSYAKTSRGVIVNRALAYDTNEPRSITTFYPAYANISGGEINAVNTTSTDAQGVYSLGNTTITGGEINAQCSANTTAFGVRVYAGETTISGSAVINAMATGTVYGVRLSEEAPTTAGVVYNSNFQMNGGTINAVATTGATAYGIYVGGATLANPTTNATNAKSYAGNYASAGIATITGGTVHATAHTTTAYGVFVEAAETQEGAEGYPAATATPQCTINGGYFTADAAAPVAAVKPKDASVLVDNFQINGGYYSHEDNLEDYAVSPKHSVALSSDDANYDPYFYKVAEAYQVAFKNGDDVLQSTYQEIGKKPVYNGETPTKASSASTSYLFDGWTIAADGTGTVYTNATIPNVTSAGATYYAHYEETDLRYIVTLDVTTNGGSCATDRIYVVPTEAIGTLPEATKDGYTFNGWFTAATGGAGVTASTVPTEDVTYYAQFTVKNYTLTWVLDGGKVGTAGKYGSTSWPAKNATGTQTMDVPYGVTLTAPVVARTGYTFSRWDPTVASTMPAEAATYTAIWNPNTNTAYSVKHYQQNVDGTYPITPTETQSLTGTTATSVTPAVKSYEGFVSPSAQTATIAADGKTVVTYQYARRHYTFTLDAATNGGTSEVPSIEVIHGATIGAVPPDAQKGCNDFTGWYTKAVGGVKITSAFVIEYDMKTLYAQFSDDIRTWPITYLPGEHGTGTVDPETKTCGEDATLSNNTFTRTGYTQTGWSTTDGGAKTNDFGDSYTANAALTLYPFWTINTRTLTWDWGGGETSSTTHTVAGSVTYGTTISYPADNTMTKANYVFSGWSTDATTMPDEDLIITAQWTPAVASVTVSGATTYYTTLPEAFAFAADKVEPTITVLDDIALAAKVTYTNTSKTTVTFDLNGHTVSGAANQLLYLTSGSSTGGTFVIKSSVDGGQIRNVLSSASSRSCVYLYKGKLKLESGTIYNENTSTGGSYAVLVNSSRTFTMTGGKLESVAPKSAYGLFNYGTATISGGNITATENSSGTVSSVYAYSGTTTLKGTLVCDITGTTNVYGAFVGGATPASDKGTTYNGTLIIEGGTFNVTANSSGTAYGVYCTGNTRPINYSASATYAGNYAAAGTLQIKGGAFTVEGKITYGVGMKATVSVNTATDADGNATYAAASATPKTTITGGKFHLKGTTTKAAVTTTATNTNQLVQGGWYNINTNLSGYVAPTKSCNYWTLPLDDATYKFEVAEAYKVTWDATTNGGSCATAYTIVKKSAAIGTLPEASKTGSDFNGWFTAASEGTQVTAATTITAAKTYYAQFAPQTYSITYKDQGDVAFSGVHGDGYPTTHTYGTATALVSPTKTGYTFAGWYDNADCTGTALTEVGATAYTADFTLYAKWTIIQYTISFNSNGGSDVASITQDYNSFVTAPADPTKTGYTFAGWSPEVPSVMPAEDTECVAQWTPNTNTVYTVNHYQQNLDGTYPSEPTDTDNETGTTDTEVTPAVKNYIGFTAPDAQTVNISADGSRVVTYQYTRNSYNLTWNANGGELSGSYTSGLVLFGTTITAPTANRANYDFNGWDEEPAATMPAEDKTYTAQWSLSAVTILWKSEDGSETLETDNLVLIGAAPSFDGTEPTKATTESYTYTFDGWTTEANGAGTFYAIGELPTVSSAATYYAHFTTTANVASVTVSGATTYYTTIDAAFAHVNTVSTNMTITLLADATAAASLVYQPKSTYTCTLDLNNHTISGAINKLIDINLAKSTFIITDNSVAKGGSVSTTLSTNARLYSVFLTAGTLKLQNGKIYANNPYKYSSGKSCAATGVYVTAGQIFTMENGTVESASQYASYAIYMARGTSTVTIKNGLVKGRTTKSTTAAGIYNLGKGLTVNGGHIVAHAYTTTAYGIYLYGGHGTINGGTIEATNDTTDNKGSTTTYGIYVNYYNSTYKGVLTIPSTSTVNVFAKARTTTAYAIVVGGGSTGNTIAGGTFTAKTKTGKTAYCVNSSGNITISGGTFTAYAATTNAYGLYSVRGTITVNGDPTFNVTAGSTTAYGALAYGTIGKKGTGKYSGTIEINGGTFNVTSTAETAWGAYAGLASRDLRSCSATNDTVPGLHYMPGILVVNDGTFNVKATTTGAFGIVVAKAKSESGTVGTTARIPLGTVTGGKFKVESMGDANATAYAMNSATTEASLVVQGGYYNTKRTDASETPNIEDKYTAPAKSCNYHVLPLEGEDPYKYEVAEAYTLTWELDGGTVTTAGTGAAVDATDAPNTIVKAGASITAPVVTKTGYTFDGWSPAVAATMPAANTTYTATWKVDIVGDRLDIVDWTSSTLTINANGWKASGWPYSINGTSYEKGARAADRTLTINYSGSVGEDLSLTLKDKESNIISLHKYRIPFIGTTEGVTEADTIYVNSGTLDIDASTLTNVGGLYVRPEASVEVTNGTLTVGKLVMRTLPWQAAAISGNFTAAETWYTRIAPNNRTINGPGGEITYESARYYQFALPLDCTVPLSEIHVSHGANTPYGNTWLLKYYSEESRSTNGASGDNWVAVAMEEKEKETYHIQGGVGYEMSSNSNYYREFYFPVGAVNSEELDVKTAVSYHYGAAGVDHAGWNIICSPLMSVYNNAGAHPIDGLKISKLMTDGSYDQDVHETVEPAIPFSYQATSSGFLYFEEGGLAQKLSAPRRMSSEDEQIETEWIRVSVLDDDGRGDHTSIFVHPNRFEPTYETGIDVAKQSFTASRALIYSSHAYGEMAFAGVADSLLEKGVALTIYSPSAQSLTISMRENNWLNRMEYVWLIDKETGIRTDLLTDEYSFYATEGTTAGRFFIEGVFAPKVTTDIQNDGMMNDEMMKARKLLIDDKIYIDVNGRRYDATGKLVNGK